MISSAIIGTVVGHIYGLAFMLEKKQVHPSICESALTKKLTIFAIGRYLLLAGCLGVLFTHNLVHPFTMLGGVLVGFWLVVIKQARKRHENRII